MIDPHGPDAEVLKLYRSHLEEMRQRSEEAGFTIVFWGGRPAEEDENTPQGYLLAQKR